MGLSCNRSKMHVRMQAELVDVLKRGRKNPRVHMEWKVPNQQGGEFIIDVADLTEVPYIYYEIEEAPSEKIQRYREAFAAGTGVDVVVMYVSEMRKEYGDNPRVNELRSWIKDRVLL
jgi:hypothetical protein